MSLSVQQRGGRETEKEAEEVRKTGENRRMLRIGLSVKDKIQGERSDQFSNTKETTGLKHLFSPKKNAWYFKF